MAERQIRQIHSPNIEQPKTEIKEPSINTVVEQPNVESNAENDFISLDNNGAKDLPFRQESEDATQRLVNYIEKQMEYFNNKLTFAVAANNPPNPYEIEIALSQWIQTSFSINSMYELAQTDADNAEAELRQYFNIKKAEVRTKFNRIDLKKASWLSATEIEATVYSVYKQDIAKLEAKVVELKREASFLKNMQKSWSDYLWVLRSLKDMSVAEFNGMKVTPDLRRGDEIDLM